MDLLRGLRQFVTVTGLTLRYLLGTRRVIPTALLGAVPLVLTLSLAAGNVEGFDIILFQILLIPLFLQVVLIFVTLVNATTLIREEIDDNTLPFLLTRPISKPAIVSYKYLGYFAAVLALLLPSIVLAYGVTELHAGIPINTDLDVLGAFLIVTVLGTAAYGALFLFLSVMVRKPLAAGLLIGFVWESIVGMIPGDVRLLSVIHYLKSILKDMVVVGPLNPYVSTVSGGVGIAVLTGMSVAMVVFSIIRLQGMEFRQKA